MRLFVATLTLFGVVGSTIATPAMMRPAQYNNATTAPAEDRHRYNTEVQMLAQDVAGPNGKVNVGYFVNWGIYGRNFQPQDVDVSKLTHILYAFADCDATTGTAKLTDTYADQEKHYTSDSWSEPGTNLYGAMKQLYLLKKANRGLKTLLSFGGWTYSQSGHFNFVTSPSARATFISTAITLLEDNGFDGIDIDYEYPSSTEQGNGFAALISELRSSLDAHARNKGDAVSYLVTAAVGAGPTGYNNLPIPQLNSALSFWNLMAYDYAGSWSTVSDDQANLYPGQTTTGFSTETALNYYLSHGASANKIVMGIPLYGRAFTNTAGIRKPFSGVGSGSWENGVWDYKDLPRPGSTVTEESDSVAAYCYDGAQTLVSYDTPSVVNKKAAYISNKGLAGGMYWELSNDKKGTDSLVGTVARAFGTLDTTQNHLSYPGSKFDNIRNQMGGSTSTASSSSSAPTTTSVPVSTPPASSTSSTASGGTCAGVAAWASSTIYTAGMQVTYGGSLWQAKWWTQGETPKVYDGSPWNQLNAC